MSVLSYPQAIPKPRASRLYPQLDRNDRTSHSPSQSAHTVPHFLTFIAFITLTPFIAFMAFAAFITFFIVFATGDFLVFLTANFILVFVLFAAGAVLVFFIA